jgi:DnaK suppressor protein
LSIERPIVGSGIAGETIVSFHVQKTDYPHFDQVLRARAKVLRNEIRSTLQKAGQEQFSSLAGQVHDAGEESVADLLMDVNQAEIARDVQELRDVERAQKRIKAGTYGLCAECGEPIARARLDAAPSASRCVRCQQSTENTAAATRPASL